MRLQHVLRDARDYRALGASRRGWANVNRLPVIVPPGRQICSRSFCTAALVSRSRRTTTITPSESRMIGVTTGAMAGDAQSTRTRS
jgi:hypothetical protein